MYNQYLQHHGVRGMHWGVRRNISSGLSNASSSFGNFRRNVNDNDVKTMLNQINSVNKGVINVVKNHDEKVSERAKESKSKRVSKKASEMSTKELQEVVNRMNLERQFASLNSGNQSNGKSKTMAALDTIGTVVTLASAAAGLYGTVKGITGR